MPRYTSVFDITFTSHPPNAVVSMYGQSIGRTPFTTKLQQGTYKAIYSADGYPVMSQDIAVGAGLPTTINATFQLNK